MGAPLLRFWFVATASLLLTSCGVAAEPTVQPTVPPQVAAGRTVFQQECASCHATEPETIIVGPSLAHIKERADERASGLDGRQYIELSILEPGAHIVEGFEDSMPSNFGKKLTGEELDALIAYLMTLD